MVPNVFYVFLGEPNPFRYSGESIERDCFLKNINALKKNAAFHFFKLCTARFWKEITAAYMHENIIGKT